MLAEYFAWFLFTQSVFGQLNGEFWWLNDKVSELNGKTIPPPQFDDLTEFDTDDTRILFNENVNAMKRKIINNPNIVGNFKRRPSSTLSKKNKVVNELDKIIFGDPKMEDNNKFIWPSDDGRSKMKLNNVASTQILSNNEQTTIKMTVASATQDQFGIKFPEKDTFYIPEHIKTDTTTINIDQTTQQVFESTTEATKNITDALVFGTAYSTDREKKRKNICTYIKKYECISHNGFVYTAEYGKSRQIGPKDPTLICCVLAYPIKKNSENITKIVNEDIVYFPDKISPHIRTKRSDDDLRQRHVLLQRRRNQETKTKSVPVEIVTTDDEDPYWNIKNSFKTTNKPATAADYEYNEGYAQEYTDEIPRPGLLGIYSDSGRKPNNWPVIKQDKTYGGDDDYDDVDDTETSFGYGTIDPRGGSPKKRKKPIKIITTEEKYNPESQIINFQSNPNFEVLQGFKLLNLVRNKNKMLSKTNNESEDNEDQESIVSTFLTSSENAHDVQGNHQLSENCGKTTTTLKQKDTQTGDAEEGSHPWLIVVTPASDQSDILCYGTLVHPRAAITAADCVSEIASNNFVVLAGLWKLNDKTNVKKRNPQVHLHPKYKAGNIANNLAILTWSRPFKLCDDVQPACLAEPRQGKDCLLYGWGGFDQALRLRSRWQKARMQECGQPPASKSNLPNNAFCATVQSRGTVSGVGGPLICNVNGRDAVVGVGVSRDSDIMFLPAKEWAMKAQGFVYED